MPQIQKKRQSITEDIHWSHHLPQQIPDHQVPHTFAAAEQSRTADHNPFEEIPQLEDEDWENGRFKDADNNILDHHNT